MFLFQEKNGIKTDEVCNVYDHIRNTCKGLKIIGLMTIGSLDASLNSSNKNPDFEALVQCRENICKKFNIDLKQVELSMGMSHDYEQAVSVCVSILKKKSKIFFSLKIIMGSSNVRIGSSIFGSR